MKISAVDNSYNLSLKSQYDNAYQNDTTAQYGTYQNDVVTDYPAYMDDGMYTDEAKSSSNMLGLAALGVLAVAGIGYGIYKHRDSASIAKELKTKKDELAETAKKLTEAEEKKTTAEKALDTANKTIEDLKKQLPKTDKDSKPGIFKRLKNWWNGKSKKS